MADSVQITLGANVAGALAGLASFTRAAQVAGAAFVAAFTEGTRRAINFADEVGKAAQKAGVAVDEFSKLAYAGQLAGVEMDGLKTAFKGLSAAMQENGKVFDQIGVSRYGAGGGLRGAADVLEDIADVFQSMPDGARKTTLAVQLFGKAGQDLIPILNQGREGIREQKREAEELGVVISTRLAKDAEAFNDNLTRIGQGLKGLFLSVAETVLPTLIRASESAVSAIKTVRVEFDALKQEWSDLFAKVFGSSQMAGYSGLVNNRFLPRPGANELDFITREQYLRSQISETDKLRTDGAGDYGISDRERNARTLDYLKTRMDLVRKLRTELEKSPPPGSLGSLETTPGQLTKEADEYNSKLLPVLREEMDIRQQINRLESEGSFSGQLASRLGAATSAAIDFSSRAAETITNGVLVAVDGLADSITGLIQGTRNWADVWRSVTSNILGMVVQLIVRFTVLAGLVSLLGFLFPGSAFVSKFTKFAGFASGGFTGVGPTDQVAGVVHKGEYVVNASTLNRLGAGALDSMQAGYTPNIATPAYGVGGQGGSAKVSIGFINGQGQMADWLQSGEGRKVLIDVMSQEIHHFRG